MDVPVFGDSTWIQKANYPRCCECYKRTSKPAYCFFCREAICSKCTRHETWADAQVTVCKSCREAGKEVEADIKRDEQAYEQKGQ